jgi:carbamoyltransferase
MIAGLARTAYGAAAALGGEGRLLAACPQERVTRTRGRSGEEWPEAALDLLLSRLSLRRADVDRFVVAETGPGAPYRPNSTPVELVDHHRALACTAYLTSPFDGAAVVVCDRQRPGVQVWIGDGPELRQVDWAWDGMGFAETYARMARQTGFSALAGEFRFEELARLRPAAAAAWAVPLLRLEPGAIVVEELPLAAANGADAAAADAAAALQARLGDLMVELLAEVQRRTKADRLCAGGSLFGHSSMATRAKTSAVFSDVFVPIDPSAGGLAVGATLHALGMPPAVVSPFLGPAYAAEEIKAALDNCKLTYSWEPEERAVQIAVKALMDGRLVGWYDGAMEWGPRALGARCILASPFAPYVLENLNRFLKHRDPWRGYALSGLESDVAAHLEGPPRAAYMECDYRPKDPSVFRHILPSAEARLRVQTVDGGAPPRFRHLLEAFGAASGLPFLVNTSFNGFHEPIVCSPRDAVRVFYGTGLDLLVIDQFVLQK